MRAWNPLVTTAITLAACADAADMTAALSKIDKSGTGEAVGTVTIAGGSGGAVFTTDLKGLPPGQHGFHLHTNGSCDPGPNPQGEVVAGGAAGGHWSPSGSTSMRAPRAAGIWATCRSSPWQPTAPPRRR